MNISDAGLNLIKKHEGLRLHSYQDSGGVWTIGYGSTKGVTPYMIISVDEAERRIKDDLVTVEKCLANCLKVEVTQGQYDALCSFAFNLGCGALRTSTLLSLLNDGDDTAAAAQFEHWCHCQGKVLQGLVARREAEKELFNA